MFSQDHKQLRRFYIAAWQKAQAGTPLEPLEAQIVGVIEVHPEYHALLEKGEDIVDKDFSPDGGETNPFLHMAFHLAIQDQIATDLPKGIQAIAKKCYQKQGDSHAAEHAMMECLAEQLWKMQRDQQNFDEAAYIKRLQAL